MEVEKLKSFLEEKTGLSYYNGSRTEIISWCPWCDKEHKKRHGHLYVNVIHPIFNCFKNIDKECPSAGPLPILIKKLGGNPEDYLSPDEFITNVRKSSAITIEHNTNEYKIPDIDQDVKDKKVEYIINRIGDDTNINEIPRLVIDIKKFFEINYIILNEKQEKMVNRLQNNFIGFVGNRGRRIIFRNIDSNDELKFYSIDLISSFSLNDFYGIEISSIHEGINNIILCEGVFDLLCGIKHPNMKFIIDKSQYIASVFGKSYKNTLVSILDYLKIPKCNLTVLSDSEIPYYYYYKLSKFPCINKFNIYYNKSGEDFGLVYNINPVKIDLEEIRQQKRKRYEQAYKHISRGIQ
ncbi:MAG: hypothetical protein ACOCQD_00695 [archaeon]